MDARITELERMAKLDPYNLEVVQRLLALYDRTGRHESEALRTRIWTRFLKEDISESKIEVAAKLNYKPAREIFIKVRLDLHWTDSKIKNVMRLLSARQIVLFTCDCAEHVLPIFESQLSDKQPRNAIEIARLSVERKINPQLIAEAASAASDNFPGSRAYSAAQCAARAAWCAYYAAITPGKPENAIHDSRRVLLGAINVVSYGREAEILWQQDRFSRYLVGEL